MSAGNLAHRIRERAAGFGIEVPDGVDTGCVAYLSLLGRWNRNINLTALPLTDPIPGTTLDKLILEPLAAAPLFPKSCSRWLDLGSGGGSPALPLRLVHRAGRLTMVESRERKCAFLREAVRTLELADTDVVASRFEALVIPSDVDLVTVRAVRLDESLLSLISSWVRPEGMLMGFGVSVHDVRFSAIGSKPLPDGSRLQLYARL